MREGLLTDAEVAEIARRRPEMRATLACEGMTLSAGEESLFDAMEAERLTPEMRRRRIIAFNERRFGVVHESNRG